MALWQPVLLNLDVISALCVRAVSTTFLQVIHSSVLPRCHGNQRKVVVQWWRQQLQQGDLGLAKLTAQAFQIGPLDIVDQQKAVWDWVYRKFVATPVTILCIGDSHVNMFLPFQKLPTILPGSQWTIKSVAGATAMGLVNPNSKTQALPVFRQVLAGVSNKQTLVVMQLGEVDCGFVIWYRANKYGLDIQSQLHQSLSNYFGFVQDDVVGQGFCKIVICSATLPTIQDNCDWGEVATARRDVKATLLERTALTVIYNQQLKQFCDSNGFYYLNMEKHTLDPRTGVVKKKFLNPNRNDHHLNLTQLFPYLLSEVKQLGVR